MNAWETAAGSSAAKLWLGPAGAFGSVTLIGVAGITLPSVPLTLAYRSESLGSAVASSKLVAVAMTAELAGSVKSDGTAFRRSRPR